MGEAIAASVNEGQYQPLDRREVTALLQPLMAVNTAIYWADLLFSLFTGWVAFAALVSSSSILLKIISYLVSVFAFLRAIGFIHEISHQSKGRYARFMRRFRVVWNLLVGVPFMLSSPYYSCHHAHHSVNTFGTADDPQYMYIKGKPGRVLDFLIIQALRSTLLLTLRVFVFVPLSLFIRPLRTALEEKHSSIGDPDYVTRFCEEDRKILLLNDVLSTLFWYGMIILVYPGIISIYTPGALYGVIFGVMLMNAFRILGEHTFDRNRYDAEENSQMRVFLNTYNYSRGGLLIDLLYHTGLRYHALHHYMPQIPYHNLSKAHRMLVKNLASESAYHSVEAKGHIANIMNLMKN